MMLFQVFFYPSCLIHDHDPLMIPSLFLVCYQSQEYDHFDDFPQLDVQLGRSYFIFISYGIKIPVNTWQK